VSCPADCTVTIPARPMLTSAKKTPARLSPSPPGGNVWRPYEGPQSGSTAESKTVPRRLHVSIDEQGTGELEVTDCDLQFCRENGRPAAAVRFHGAGGSPCSPAS
jgi:hypothetical protein